MHHRFVPSVPVTCTDLIPSLGQSRGQSQVLSLDLFLQEGFPVRWTWARTRRVVRPSCSPSPTKEPGWHIGFPGQSAHSGALLTCSQEDRVFPLLQYTLSLGERRGYGLSVLVGLWLRPSSKGPGLSFSQWTRSESWLKSTPWGWGTMVYPCGN